MRRLVPVTQKTFYLFFVMIMVTGCAVPYEKTLALYQDAPLSCRSMSEFAFEPLSKGEPASYDLNEKSPAYQFSSGKSFFKAFILPQDHYPYFVTVKSFLQGDAIDSAYIFFPQVMTLNDAFEPVRASAPDAFRLKKSTYDELKRHIGATYNIHVTLPFTEENSAEKYLVILTTSELLKAKSSLSTLRSIPIILPGVVGLIPIGSREVLVPHSPFASIEVSIEPREEHNL